MSFVLIEKQWMDFTIGPIRTNNPNFMIYFLLSLCLIYFVGFHNWVMVQGLKALGKYKTVLFCFFDLFFLIFFIFIDWSMV